ncbi:MAG: TRAP transporter permease [Hyphomicrobiaceae bacterium]
MEAPRAHVRATWVILGGLSIAFHIGLIFSGLVSNLVARPLHMALALPWIFLFAARSKIDWWSGTILTGFGWAGCAYIVFHEAQLADQYGSLDGPFQLVLAAGLLAIVLEMARRAIGWPLPLIASIALLYGLWGEFLPGEFGHPGLPVESLLGTMVIAEGGLWGSLTGVSVNIVAVFVILGAVLSAGEAGDGFMNLAKVAAGRLQGGAAKVSIVSSALFGSISGSASANVASTGAITLPAMRRLGYPRSLAGAVEAVASSGGQIMPPLMGAGAFVMVELTGIPYPSIMAAALLPALLYFATVWAGINAFSSRYELRPLPVAEQPRMRTLIITVGFFAVPFATLMERMFVGGYTPQFAAACAILVAFLLLPLDQSLKVSVRRTLDRLEAASLTAGQQIATIASIILCATIVISVLGQTGIGIKITSLILSAGNDHLWPALFLTAIACLLLGMEVPTTAAYVICISVAGPALQKLGLEPLIAHLFVFWFALLSTITPPVCGAVFIAAGMVGENWLRVAMSAMALGVGLYVIPLAIVANPMAIQLETAPAVAIIITFKLLVGLVALSMGLISPRRIWQRVGLLLAGLGLVFIDPTVF